MYTVYLIRSIKFPDEKYVGFTEDFESRLKAHNEGKSIHTASYRPWELICRIDFQDKKQALDFEHYLKSGSGRAFAQKRLWK